MSPFVRAPLFSFEPTRRNSTVQPVVDLFINALEGRRIRNPDVVRHSRLVYPLLDLIGVYRTRVLFEQVSIQILKEFFGRDALKSKLVEITFEKLIETAAPKSLFKVIQQEFSLEIGHFRKTGVRIYVSQIDSKDLSFFGQSGQVPLQIVVVHHLFHVPSPDTIGCLHEPILKVSGKSFVEPQIPPGSIRNQIARPGMSEFMRDKRDQTLVAGNNHRRYERQAWVFHPAKGEARWQYK